MLRFNMKKPKKIKIIERKLGRSGVWGFCWENGRIEIDKSLKGKRRLRICIHELCHAAFGDKVSEKDVLRAEKIIGNALWEQNYRRVDQ
jgi:hypothetical protein